MKYATLILSVVAVLAYLVIYGTFGQIFSKFVVDSLALGLAVVISGSWSSAAVRSIKNGGSTAEDKIILTIWGAWTTLLVQRSYVILSTLLNKPDWLTSSPMPGLITTLILVVGMYALIAPVQSSKAPHQEIPWILVSTLIGGLVSGVVIGIFYAQQALGAHF